MKTPFAFVLVVLGLSSLGAYLLTHDHETAGAWTLAIGLISALGGYEIKYEAKADSE